MTWEISAVLIAAFTAVVALTWVVLPYVRARGEHEKRLFALEAANAQLEQTTAEITKMLGAGHLLPRGLPRAL